jgi:hypothetical protein
MTNVVVLLFLSLSALAPAPARAAKVEIDPSIMVFNAYDWDRCARRVTQVKADGATRANFVITLGFVLPKAATELEGYCYFDKGGGCTPIKNQSLIRKYTQSMAACFKLAAQAGLAITITPHLDDSSSANRWRNDLVFDPLAHYAFGYSYADVMLQPILNAVLQSNSPDSAVEMAMEGEMGATIGHYPQSYLLLLAEFAQKMAGWSNLKFGISLNFNKVFGTNEAPADLVALQNLLNKVDFVGFSNYNAVDYPATRENFATGLESWLGEVAAFGVTVPEIKPIHFTEFGLGGGSGDEKTPTTDPSLSALAPYSGVRGRYSSERDPWLNATMKDFRFQYYAELGDFLENQKSKWQVARVFTWNSDSWDINGLYSGDYRDEKIVDYLRNFNQR